MGKINLTAEQKRELEANNSLTLPYEGAVRQGRGTYHNPVTGQELRNAPMDNWHMWLRLRQGWKLGSASPELREKWKIREAELRAEDEKLVEEYKASHEHEEDQRTRYNEDVKSAVLAVLDHLGVDLPDKSGAEPITPAPAPEEQENTEGTQLPLWGSDAEPPKLELVKSDAT